MTGDAQELPRGTRLLDRYTIIDRVASGGMATIHRAMDERLERIVCVKLLRLELDGPPGAEGGAKSPIYSHFVREALALSRLQHPNTLRIYDFGYLDDGHRPFQISEFLDGGNLRQRVRAHGALVPEETLEILERITGAIAEAHEQRILHRDIKPSNILFSRIGDVLMPKLADFGIARTGFVRRSPHDQGKGPPGSPSLGMFSPRWAAPEQLASGTEGPYTDVYALGLVTAYMLTGVALFDGGNLPDAVQERARSDERLRERMTQMGLRPDVTSVLSRAVASDPSSRTQNPLVFFEELRATLGGARTSLPPAHKEIPRPTEQEPDVAAFSISSSESRSLSPPEASAVGPVDLSGRRVRVVEAYEKLELDIAGNDGSDVRFRVSILPERESSFHIQIKGLNCFVSKVGPKGAARPSPAVSAAEDGVVEFVSAKRRPLARVSFAFGRPAADGQGRVFATTGSDLVVPSLNDLFALALDMGPEREIIVMCKRA